MGGRLVIRPALALAAGAMLAGCVHAGGGQGPDPMPPAGAAPAPVAAVPDPLVRATQSELIRLGYLRGGADGFAGHKTRAAITGFEEANGLRTDGMASTRLLTRLRATPSPGSAAAPAAWLPPENHPDATPVSAPAPPDWVEPVKTP